MASLDTREDERDSMFLMADITPAATDDQPPPAAARVRVRNLSAGGMMAQGDIRVVRGQRLTIELRAIGAIAGTVVWVRGDSFGIAFAREIDPKLCRTKVTGGDREAPVYARAALPAPRHDGWNGKLRRI